MLVFTTEDIADDVQRPPADLESCPPPVAMENAGATSTPGVGDQKQKKHPIPSLESSSQVKKRPRRLPPLGY